MTIMFADLYYYGGCGVGGVDGGGCGVSWSLYISAINTVYLRYESANMVNTN